MMGSAIIAFWGVSLALVMTPGADWAYAITAGMRDKALAPAIAGLLLGYVGITLVVAAGIGSLVAEHPMVLTCLTVTGAAYLLWMGIGLLKNPPLPSPAIVEVTANGQWVVRGFGISGLNPKALLLFLALLPQFTSVRAPIGVPAQIVVLGLVHMANCLVVYAFVGLASKAVLRTRPEAARMIGRISGTIMVALALILVIERLVLQG